MLTSRFSAHLDVHLLAHTLSVTTPGRRRNRSGQRFEAQPGDPAVHQPKLEPSKATAAFKTDPLPIDLGTC